MIDCAVTSGDATRLVNVTSALSSSLKKFGSVSIAFSNDHIYPPIPDPDRSIEILLALAFLAVCFGSFSMEVRFRTLSDWIRQSPFSLLNCMLYVLVSCSLLVYVCMYVYVCVGIVLWRLWMESHTILPQCLRRLSSVRAHFSLVMSLSSSLASSRESALD